MPCTYLLQGGCICNCDRPSDSCATAVCCTCRLGRCRVCRTVGTTEAAAAAATAAAVCVFCFLCYLQPCEGAAVTSQRLTAQLLAIRQPYAPDRTCMQETTAFLGQHNVSGTPTELTFAQELTSRAARGQWQRSGSRDRRACFLQLPVHLCDASIGCRCAPSVASHLVRAACTGTYYSCARPRAHHCQGGEGWRRRGAAVRTSLQPQQRRGRTPAGPAVSVVCGSQVVAGIKMVQDTADDSMSSHAAMRHSAVTGDRVHYISRCSAAAQHPTAVTNGDEVESPVAARRRHSTEAGRRRCRGRTSPPTACTGAAPPGPGAKVPKPHQLRSELRVASDGSASGCGCTAHGQMKSSICQMPYTVMCQHT
jgi:hypothetical protein